MLVAKFARMHKCNNLRMVVHIYTPSEVYVMTWGALLEKEMSFENDDLDLLLSEVYEFEYDFNEEKMIIKCTGRKI